MALSPLSHTARSHVIWVDELISARLIDKYALNTSNQSILKAGHPINKDESSTNIPVSHQITLLLIKVTVLKLLDICSLGWASCEKKRAGPRRVVAWGNKDILLPFGMGSCTFPQQGLWRRGEQQASLGRTRHTASSHNTLPPPPCTCCLSCLMPSA